MKLPLQGDPPAARRPSPLRSSRELPLIHAEPRAPGWPICRSSRRGTWLRAVPRLHHRCHRHGVRGGGGWQSSEWLL